MLFAVTKPSSMHMQKPLVFMCCRVQYWNTCDACWYSTIAFLVLQAALSPTAIKSRMVEKIIENSRTEAEPENVMEQNPGNVTQATTQKKSIVT